MIQEKVPFEVAEAEVSAWLDSKKISAKKREKNESIIDVLVDAVSGGLLSIDPETKNLTQYLQFPLGADASITSLTYKARISQEVINAKLKNAKATDSGTVIVSYISALTDQPSAIIVKQDSSDYSVGQAIASFFI